MFKYVIVGGGTAGWLTALFVKEKFPYSDVTVIASSEIGILGAGEGTTPPFINFLAKIKINPDEIISNCLGTVKTGIKFTNWCGDTKHYYHNFLSDTRQGDSALHFDANLLAKYLQTVGIERGIKLVDDEVTDVCTDSNNNITGLMLKDKTSIDLDFVFDCSGFRRLIIGKHYNAKWASYKKILPVDRAMPFFLQNDNTNLPVYTEAIALRHGWMWKIPVQGRYGCGYVFDSGRATDSEIKEEIEEHLGHEIVSPRMFSFDAGCFEDTWINNCVAIGLSSGFSEPLEATSIWVQITSLTFLLKNINGIISIDAGAKRRYNDAVKTMNSEIAKFLHFHYLTNRQDSDFWRSFEVPTVFNMHSSGELLTFAEYSWEIIRKGIGYGNR